MTLNIIFVKRKAMKSILLIIAIITSTLSFSQSEGSDIGLDGYFGASNFGGSFGIGAKYGIKFKEYFIAGPSLRYQRTWSNNQVTGTQGSFNVFGGGGFLHARIQNVLFLGAEIEMLKSPYNYTFLTGSSANKWIPTAFVGGGFSREFNESWRLNLGIMYDVINNPSSPFFNSYFMRRKDGSRIPVIYRVAFFFPIS